MEPFLLSLREEEDFVAGKQTLCVHDGDTYLGTFDESGRGKDATITVRYSGRELSAVLGSTNARAAARSLLSQLVRDLPAARPQR